MQICTDFPSFSAHLSLAKGTLTWIQHKQRVRFLYRNLIRFNITETDNYFDEDFILLKQLASIRTLIEKNRHITDLSRIDQLVRISYNFNEAEKCYWNERFYQAWGRGGVAFMRSPYINWPDFHRWLGSNELWAPIDKTLEKKRLEYKTPWDERVNSWNPLITKKLKKEYYMIPPNEDQWEKYKEEIRKNWGLNDEEEIELDHKIVNSVVKYRFKLIFPLLIASNNFQMNIKNNELLSNDDHPTYTKLTNHYETLKDIQEKKIFCLKLLSFLEILRYKRIYYLFDILNLSTHNLDLSSLPTQDEIKEKEIHLLSELTSISPFGSYNENNEDPLVLLTLARQKKRHYDIKHSLHYNWKLSTLMCLCNAWDLKIIPNNRMSMSEKIFYFRKKHR